MSNKQINTPPHTHKPVSCLMKKHAENTCNANKRKGINFLTIEGFEINFKNSTTQLKATSKRHEQADHT